MATKSKSYTVDQLAEELAEIRGIDKARAAKDVRARLRRNFADVVEADPNVSKIKSAANDGNRWPAMNAKVRSLVIPS